MTVAPDVVSFEAALALCKLQAASLGPPSHVESVPLLSAHGRILAEPLLADRDQPLFDRSTRDGFAVKAADCNPDRDLLLMGTIRAGTSWTGEPLQSNQAIEIMTGAPLPPGADAVLMVEHVLRSPDQLQANGQLGPNDQIGANDQTRAKDQIPPNDQIRPKQGRSLQPGENIVPRAAEARAGTVVLPAGSPIGPAEIALAASCGYAELPVYGRPQVAILATGDELVELAIAPGPNQIRNSNSYALAAMVESAGGEALRLPIVPDERNALAAALRRAQESDLIVLSGGVSMGVYDLVEEMLLAAGAVFFFTGVKMQPGKPVVFGRLPDASSPTAGFPAAAGRFFFGLPGNPVSTQLTFLFFVAPFLRALAGEGPVDPRWTQAVLAETTAGKPSLTRLVPCTLQGIHAHPVQWQGSGDLPGNARAHCYAELPPDREEWKAGDHVRILLR